MNEQPTTIEQKLRGKFPLLTDDNINSICDDAGVEPGSVWRTLSPKERDMSFAWSYVTLSDMPSTSQKVSDKDGDWSHSEGGTNISESDKKRWLQMANELFAKWGEPTIGKERWGMICGGFHNIRHYGGR